METPAGKPFRLSWSRLKELDECRAKGWLHSQGKFSEFRDSRVFFPGTVVDRAMRAWLEADVQVPGGMAATVDEIFDREEATTRENNDGVVKWRGPDDRERTREKCRECCRRLEPILLREVVPFDYQVAARFTVPIVVPYQGRQREMNLTGEMDLLVRDPAGLKIKDLKMTENPDYWKQTYPQLLFYEIACFAMKLGWAVETSLIQPMCVEPVLPFRFEQAHRQEMYSRIVKCAEYWWNNDHSPKADNAGCSWCPAKHACPKKQFTGNRRVLSSSAPQLPVVQA